MLSFLHDWYTVIRMLPSPSGLVKRKECPRCATVDKCAAVVSTGAPPPDKPGFECRAFIIARTLRLLYRYPSLKRTAGSPPPDRTPRAAARTPYLGPRALSLQDSVNDTILRQLDTSEPTAPNTIGIAQVGPHPPGALILQPSRSWNATYQKEVVRDG